jgi:hypothetical protein
MQTEFCPAEKNINEPWPLRANWNGHLSRSPTRVPEFVSVFLKKVCPATDEQFKKWRD